MRVHALRHLARQFDDSAVVGDYAVDFLFDIAHLRVHRRGQSLGDFGYDLFVVQFFERFGKGFLRFVHLVAEEFVRVEHVPFGGQGIAAEFAEHYATLVVGYADGFEIYMQTLELRGVFALVVPAADAVDDAGAVHGGEFPRHFHGIELSPAFVEDDPHRHGHAILETVHRLEHFALEFLPAFLVGAGEEFVAVVLEVYSDEGQGADRREFVGRAARHHILPHKYAFAVAMVVPAQRLDLDVFPYHVEAHGFDELDIVFEGGVGGRCEHTVRPVALVEHARVEVGLVVERKTPETFSVGDDGEFPHPEIGAHDILADIDIEVVKFGVFGRPELVFGQVYDDGVALGFLVDECVAPVGHHQVDAVRLARYVQFDYEFVTIDVGDDGHIPEIGLGHAFHPHRLPYSGLRRVPYSAVLDALFAARMIGSVGRVGDDELQGVGALFDHIGDIEGEGSVTADVRAYLPVVEIDAAGAVHRVEMQEGVRLEKARFDFEFQAVIENIGRGDFHALGQPRKQTLGRVGHEYLALPAGKLFRARAHCVVPVAVEIEITVARKLRPRIFRKRLVADLERRLESYGVHNPSVSLSLILIRCP